GGKSWIGPPLIRERENPPLRIYEREEQERREEVGEQDQPSGSLSGTPGNDVVGLHGFACSPALPVFRNERMMPAVRSARNEAFGWQRRKRQSGLPARISPHGAGPPRSKRWLTIAERDPTRRHAAHAR